MEVLLVQQTLKLINHWKSVHGTRILVAMDTAPEVREVTILEDFGDWVKILTHDEVIEIMAIQDKKNGISRR